MKTDEHPPLEGKKRSRRGSELVRAARAATLILGEFQRRIFGEGRVAPVKEHRGGRGGGTARRGGGEGWQKDGGTGWAEEKEEGIVDWLTCHL